jgi:translation initiation factor IF-2
MFDQLRAAAEAQYRNEIDAIKLGAMYGATADPLSMRRIGERYTNAIRGIAAQERMAGRRELYRDRIRDRVAAAKTAKAETNAIAADALRRNAERYSTMADTSAEAVQRKNQEYLDRLVREYRAAPTEPAAPAAPAALAPRAPAAAPIPGPAPVAPPATEPEFVGPATWLQYYRDAPQQEQPGFGQIAQEVRRLAGETPTGQLSSVTAPSSDEVVTPAPDKYGDWFSWVEEGGDIPKEARLTKEDLSAALIGEEQMQPTNLQRLAELANTFTPGGYRFGHFSSIPGNNRKEMEAAIDRLGREVRAARQLSPERLTAENSEYNQSLFAEEMTNKGFTPEEQAIIMPRLIARGWVGPQPVAKPTQFATPAPRDAAAPVSTVPPPELLATLPPDQRAYVERELANRKSAKELEELAMGKAPNLVGIERAGNPVVSRDPRINPPKPPSQPLSFVPPEEPVSVVEEPPVEPPVEPPYEAPFAYSASNLDPYSRAYLNPATKVKALTGQELRSPEEQKAIQDQLDALALLKLQRLVGFGPTGIRMAPDKSYRRKGRANLPGGGDNTSQLLEGLIGKPRF